MAEEKDLITTEQTSVEIMTKDLAEKTEKIVADILAQEDPDKMKQLIGYFNMAQSKKDVLRTLSYNQLLDAVTDQMNERVTKRADQFSNKDLLDYMNTMNSSLDRARKQINSVDDTPVITFNQQNNTVIVGEDTLDRESKRRVADAVKSILKKLDQQKNVQKDLEIIEEEPVLNNEIETNFVIQDDDI